MQADLVRSQLPREIVVTNNRQNIGIWSLSSKHICYSNGVDHAVRGKNKGGLRMKAKKYQNLVVECKQQHKYQDLVSDCQQAEQIPGSSDTLSIRRTNTRI
jgi:hypothetical protein